MTAGDPWRQRPNSCGTSRFNIHGNAKLRGIREAVFRQPTRRQKIHGLAISKRSDLKYEDLAQTYAIKNSRRIFDRRLIEVVFL
jgi:hypothetical protein